MRICRRWKFVDAQKYIKFFFKEEEEEEREDLKVKRGGGFGWTGGYQIHLKMER